jgi:glycogen operon protein
VSYAAKHNEANGEQNRDGTSDNRSWNNGVEGPTDDPAIRAARLNDQRALLASLILARGTPMLVMGSETGQSQGGNNNAYAQDNEISWINWDLSENARDLREFVVKLIELRNAQPLLHRESWRDMMSLTWLNTSGSEQQAAHWADGGASTIGLRLSRDDLQGQDGIWWEIIVVFNPYDGEVDFSLPQKSDGSDWVAAINTADPEANDTPVVDNRLKLVARSLVLLH